MDLKDTYNKIAENWHKDHSIDDWWVEGTDHYVAFLPKNARVLDVGCGSGVKSKYLFDRGISVLGIDFSEKLVAIAKREVPGAQFQVMDMRDIGELSGEFDGIFAQASLLHIPKKEIGGLLSNFCTKLKPGGLLYIAVKEARQGKPDEEIKIETDYGYPYERFFSYFTKDELREYLRELKLTTVFEDRMSQNGGKTYWLQIVGKK